MGVRRCGPLPRASGLTGQAWRGGASDPARSACASRRHGMAVVYL